MKPQNRIVIAASYFFCALNCFIAWVVSFVSNASIDKSIVFLGIIMLVLIPVSFIDPRTRMRNNFAAVASIILHFLFNLLIAILFSLIWFFPLFVFETSLLIVIYFFLGKGK